MRRLAALALCGALLLGLCGCGSVFEKEYVVVSDYVPAVPGSVPDEERITVSNLDGLRQALLLLVYDGAKESSIAFDADYEGEISEDMASACWQIRTQDALCAYCVENISYDLTKIVNYYEAHITIRYSSAVCAPAEVLRRPYSSGMDELLQDMMRAGKTRLAVLVNSSFYSAEGMEELVSGVYREDPSLSPQQPNISVMMLSGSEMQRLYEIDLDYGMPPQERERRLAQLDALEPFAEAETEALDEAHRALAACRWLEAHCAFDPAGGSSLYAALIGGKADDEGMAFAYVRLCALLGLECRMVYGQRSWEDYCWNIVTVDGGYYHVDPVLCSAGDYENGFLLGDEEMWEDCRWDVSAYPACAGELSWYALAVADGLIEAPEPTEEPETEIEAEPETESEDAPETAEEAEEVPAPAETDAV